MKICLPEMQHPVIMQSDGLIQTIKPGNNKVLARFDDGEPAIILVKPGKGSLYYLASPLRTGDYHLLLSPLANLAGLNRPVVGVNKNGDLVTGAEVRAVEREKDYLVYASNLTSGPVEFDLKGTNLPGTITDLRSQIKYESVHIKLEPFRETIYRIDKIK